MQAMTVGDKVSNVVVVVRPCQNWFTRYSDDGKAMVEMNKFPSNGGIGVDAIQMS